MKNIFEQLLHALDVPYTKRFVNELYETHPNRDNLLGLWQMCKTYGISVHGVEVKDKAIDDLSVPCILHVSGRFVVVSNLENERADFDWDGNHTSLPYAELQQIWDGVALVVESVDSAKEPDYTNHKKEALVENAQRLVLFSLVAIGCVSLLSNAMLSRTVLHCIFSAIDILGIFICCLLLQKQVSIQSKVGDKICSLFHQKDCNRILESDHAKLGNFSWSEIGTGYFLAHFLGSSILPVSLFPLAFTCLCAIPFSIWSIYYQARVAKQWCVLCVIVQILLCLNALAALVFLHKALSLTIMQGIVDLAIVTAMTLAFALSTHWVMKAISTQGKLQDTTRKYRSLKGNADVFNSLLQQKRHVEVSLSDSSIVFGNPEATYKVTILSNPHCNPCAKLHQKVEDLLRTAEKDISIQYIFCSFNESLKESARFLVAIYQQKEISAAQSIYNQWFESGKFNAEDFFAAFPEVNTTTAEVTAEMEHHEQWTRLNGYASTPTVLVNEYELPNNYELADLHYLV